MAVYDWDDDKNRLLKRERGVTFEQVVMHIEDGDILDILVHPNRSRYPNQQVIIVRINDYAYAVPFVETGEKRFLKTIIPSRRLTRTYLG